MVDPELPLLLWGHIYNHLNRIREHNLAAQRLQLGADVFGAGNHARSYGFSSANITRPCNKDNSRSPILRLIYRKALP
jgi:hypothetical protein